MQSKRHPLTEDTPPNDVLTNWILFFFPQLVPDSFHICHLDPESFSWACKVAQIIGLSWMLKKKAPTKESIKPGDDGRNYVSSSATDCHHYLQEYPQTAPFSFSKPSLNCSKKENLTQMENFKASVCQGWQRRLSKVLQALYLRRSGAVSGAIPCATKQIKD